jgi:hypothetical protein
MTTSVVFDIHVEEYHMCRVMTQFNMYQKSPPPVVHMDDASVHR